MREIGPRLPRSHFREFQDLVETWPWEADGHAPRDADRLFQVLLDWRDRAERLPPDPPEPAAPVAAEPASVAPPPARCGGGRAARAVFGLVLGGIGGAILTFLGGIILVPMPSGDAAIGIVVASALAGLACGVLGAVLAAGRR